MFSVDTTPVWGEDARGDVTVRDGERAGSARCRMCGEACERGWTVVTGRFAGESRCDTCGNTEN